VADRNRVQKHVARARIILGSAARLSVAEVARHAGVGRPAVWRWQERFVDAGVDGLLRDATRKPGKVPLGDAMIHRVVALTCAEPPGEATHWTGRAMAETAGISLRSVQRIWAAHDLQPHRIRTFKVLRWLARHPRWVFHFTPTSGSWLNAVETFFSALTRRRIRRGSFHAIVDLQAAINRYIAEHNADPKPFNWTKPADQILAKVNRLNASVH